MAFYVGQLFLLLACFLLIPLGLAFYDNLPGSILAYGVTAILSLVCGFALRFFHNKEKPLKILRKDAFGIVGFGWIAVGIMAGLPFLFEGSITNLSSAIFEAISGLTTTGATVIVNIDGLSRPTHIWRNLLHWIGGMGIVVLFVAIFPQIGLGGKHLFRSEVTGPISEGLKPRIKQTAMRLWWIYLLFTTTCCSLLYLAGLPIFDAICHALSTLSTGGFSTKSASVGAFQNPMAEWIIIFFMFVGGVNFGLYYGAARGKISAIYHSIEFRWYLYINIFVTVFIFLSIIGASERDWISEFRSVLFQTLAVTTTTGLMTDDFDSYPLVGKFLLFFCMFIGGCAGSTAGGMKVSRLLVIFKRTTQELRLFLHPQEVVSTKLGKQKIRPGIISTIFIFATAYLFLYVLGIFIMLLFGMNFMTAASSVIACLASVGPGFADVGPTQSYAFVHPLAKLVLCFYMIAGRLEVFVLLSLFTRSFWRRG